VRDRARQLPVGSAALQSGGGEPYRYSLADLEEATGLAGRTIRYYITEGLLPAAQGRGKGATYSAEHLLRLKAVEALKKSNTPLNEIREQLKDMQQKDLAAMLQVETAPPVDRWRRIHLHDDIELHVRERAGRNRDFALERVVDTIVKQSEVLIARDLDNQQ
jgi:DNA-binding transcriptional MerR regulator